jgi:hypothetical protein
LANNDLERSVAWGINNGKGTVGCLWRRFVNDGNLPRGLIEKRLQAAIDELHADVVRVELWAYALKAFAEPIPDYVPEGKFALKRSPKTPQKSA